MSHGDVSRIEALWGRSESPTLGYPENLTSSSADAPFTIQEYLYNSFFLCAQFERRMGEPNFKNPRSETNDNRVMRGPTGSVNWLDPRTTTNEQRTWAKPPLEANWFNPRPYDNSSVAWGTKPSVFVDPMTEFKMKK
ncbi:hypothetical protein NQZ79_g8050 [Umbelopsis isabellina]|nr:hypothetical protein NQZ79_g8050 [Umbelopsis isabellina]